MSSPADPASILTVLPSRERNEEISGRKLSRKQSGAQTCCVCPSLPGTGTALPSTRAPGWWGMQALVGPGRVRTCAPCAVTEASEPPGHWELCETPREHWGRW